MIFLIRKSCGSLSLLNNLRYYFRFWGLIVSFNLSGKKEIVRILFMRLLLIYIFDYSTCGVRVFKSILIILNFPFDICQFFLILVLILVNHEGSNALVKDISVSYLDLIVF